MATQMVEPSAAITPAAQNLNDRLSLPLAFRLPLSMTVGAGSGFLLGIAKGSQDSGLRFQAENAHRQPSTQTGWFLYHKSKNYHMALGGIGEGLKQGARCSVWVGIFFLLEEGVDRGRASAARSYRWIRNEIINPSSRSDSTSTEGEETARSAEINRDCMSSTLAGLGTAGLFSAWNYFPVATAARTAKMGAKAGLTFGLLQDLLSVLRGRKVGYIESLKRYTVGSSDGVKLPSTANG